MFNRKYLTIVVSVALATTTFASAARADCDLAISSYNFAISDIETRLKRYTSCLGYSKGSDDCSSEFRRLRSAQSDFENAVSQYQLYCRRY
ncbi:hypothetical protein [Bradyrhizobium sp. SUTN9-2]|uniref:hypothetical protein n=1 Tax=Bradyrhizobium sp. SUTN9-2 TaxID=1167456 RepID=UPI0011B27441|nr:hypothetical protein [Bradyrhizobium sp. SUTN9-2]